MLPEKKTIPVANSVAAMFAGRRRRKTEVFGDPAVELNEDDTVREEMRRIGIEWMSFFSSCDVSRVCRAPDCESQAFLQ